MADNLFDAPEPEETREEAIQRIAELIRLAGLEGVTLAEIRDAAILSAMKLHDDDRDRVAQSLGISRETLDIHLDGHGNGLVE